MTETSTDRDVGRRYWPLAVAVLIALLVLLGIVARLFVWPATDPPTATDAVVVLSGPSARLERGLELVRAGLGTTLVLSNGQQSGWARGNALCEEPQAFEVVCFRPRPQSTAGEARGIAELADERGWDHITVVTSPSHVTRSRLLVGQCTDREVVMVAPDVPWRQRMHPVTILRESVALAAGLTVARAC